MEPAPFLQPDAADRIGQLPLDHVVKTHCLELIERGYTVIRKAVSVSDCAAALHAFRACERSNKAIFHPHRLPSERYQRIVNLHLVVPELRSLFACNPLLLAVQDACFGAETCLYTSLFYEVGSQQSIHRDSPYFATRPEHLYFGSTVYLEASDDDNGCLEVIEGGHAVPELDREAMAIRRFGSLAEVPAIDVGLWVEYQDAVVRQCDQRGLPRRRIHANAGDTLIWHPQLPHGGIAIRDQTRSRASLVMHTTPVNVPVYNADAYFRPNVAYPPLPKWQYDDSHGRKIAAHRAVSFGQDGSYAVAGFKAGAAVTA